jgi:hypothetical protein
MPIAAAGAAARVQRGIVEPDCWAGLARQLAAKAIGKSAALMAAAIAYQEKTRASSAERRPTSPAR